MTLEEIKSSHIDGSFIRSDTLEEEIDKAKTLISSLKSIAINKISALKLPKTSSSLYLFDTSNEYLNDIFIKLMDDIDLNGLTHSIISVFYDNIFEIEEDSDKEEDVELLIDIIEFTDVVNFDYFEY